MYVTHFLKLGIDQEREKEGVVILSFYDKVYATHHLKMGMDREEKKKEWLFLLILTRSTQLTC